MTITKNPSRQELVVAYVDIALAQLASGTDFTAIELPVNAVVTGGDVVVTTVFNSATTDVLDVGDASSENRLLNDANLAALGRTALVPTGFIATNTQRYLTVRWTGAGAAPTTGAFRLCVHYYVRGRAAFAQG